MEFVIACCRRSLRQTAIATLVLVALSMQPVTAEENPAAAAGKSGSLLGGLSPEIFDIPVHGFVSTRYRGRWTGDDKDNDAYATIGLDFGEAGTQPVTFHFLGTAALDLDGGGSSGYHAFDSINDAYSSDLTARLYSAHLDLHTIDFLDTVRIGRQTVYEAPELAFFDGGRVETADVGEYSIRLGAYAGLPVHLYESSPSGDLLLGAFVQAKPWNDGRARIDWMHAEDETLLGADQENDLFRISGWQGLTDYLTLHAYHTRLENDGRDFYLRATANVPEWDFQTQLSYFELLSGQKEFALEFEPFYSSMQELHPYYILRWMASKGVGDHFVAEGGYEVRRVWDEGDIGTYNREFERYYLTLSVFDLPVEKLSFSVTGEIWDSPSRETDALGAEVSYECVANVKTSIGTDYSLYRYDYLDEREREDVQTYYAKVVYKFSDQLRADLRYEFEDDDFEQYHQLRIGLRWSF